MIDERFVILGAILNTFSCIIYLIATFKGQTKPNRVTWGLWTLAPLIAFFAQIQQGIGLTALFTFSSGFGPFLVFVSSFLNKNSVWKISRFDISCGILSVMGIILWYLTQVGNIAIVFSIAADFLAALPTIVKAYKVPETESGIAFSVGTIGAFLTLLTVNHWNFAVYVFPLYIFLCDFLLVILIQFKIGKYFNLALNKIK